MYNENSEKIDKTLKEKLCNIANCKGKQIAYAEVDSPDIIQIYTDGTYSVMHASSDYDDTNVYDTPLYASDIISYFATKKKFEISNLGKELVKAGVLSECDLISLRDERNEALIKTKESSICTKALGIERFIDDLGKCVKEVNKPMDPSTIDTLFKCIDKIEKQLAEYGKHGIEI